MKRFAVYKTTYKSKMPKIKTMYAGYKGLKRGLALFWNGILIPLVLPINERCSKEGMKMKLFKTVDEKFEEIGFVKGKEDQYGAVYERNNAEYNYTQRLDLLHKASGRHIVQSYDTHLMDDKKIGNTCVGLTMYEMKLCLKKMKQMGWKAKK